MLPWVCLIFISVSQMGSGKELPEGKHQSLVCCGSTSSTICRTHSRWTLVAVSLAAIPPADIVPENGCMHAIAMSFPEGHVTVPPRSSSYILSALSHTMNNNNLCPFCIWLLQPQVTLHTHSQLLRLLYKFYKLFGIVCRRDVSLGLYLFACLSVLYPPSVQLFFLMHGCLSDTFVVSQHHYDQVRFSL